MTPDERLSNLKDHCEFLANPELNGRVPGQVGNRLARNYIRQQFEEIGLTPLFGQSWYQEYPTQASGNSVIGANVGGTLRASVENIDVSTMIIGAHYDHLEGIPGADDNASSIAIMIETARSLARHGSETRRKHLAFVAFDTEERPFYLTPDMGSVYFYNHSPMERIDCALIMDLCGHDFPIPGREDSIFIMGADSSPTLAETLPRITAEKVTPFIINDRYGGDKSDYYVFKKGRIPYVFLSVGWWECYHKPCDTLEKLNYEKMAGICALLENIIMALAAKVIPAKSVDTIELEARYLSLLTGQDIAPHRPTIDSLVSKIKSTYLGRSD
ncbi:MAG: M28 family peptidase [Desulfobacterales bacterium]|jgi:hypothetical protein